MKYYKISFISLIVLFLAMSGIAAAVGSTTDDLDTDPSTTPPAPEFEIPEGAVELTTSGEGSPSGEWLLDNGDGTFTYYEIVDKHSTPIHYYGPWNGIGFGYYNWYNEDYGWNHTFEPISNVPYKCGDSEIIEAKISIGAWDVDSSSGEIDNITVDGEIVGHLIGSGGRWTMTTFPIDPQTLDDNQLNVYMDIDSTHNSPCWGVTVESSVLAVTYSCDIIKSEPNFDVPTASPLLIIGMLGFAVVLVLRRKED